MLKSAMATASESFSATYAQSGNWQFILVSTILDGLV